MANKAEQKEFLVSITQYATQQRALIESDCAGFTSGKSASKARVERVQNDFQFFCQTYFPHAIKGAPSVFQQYLYDTLPAQIDDIKGINHVIAAPRGEAKSTIVSQLFSLWCVLTERKHFIIIVMDAYDQAVMMLEAIKAELEFNPRLMMDYSSFVGAGKMWQAGDIVTVNNVRIRVAGSGKKLRGWKHGPYRPDLVIPDDIENDDNVRSKAQRDKLHDWLKKAVMRLGPPDGSMDIIYIGTVLHYDSVLNRTLKSPVWKAAHYKAIIKWPDNMNLWEAWEELFINQGELVADSYYRENKLKMDKGALISWPLVRPLLMLMKIRAEDHYAFDCEMQNEPGNNEDAPFKDIQFWVQPNRDWVFYGAVDPSLGKNNKARDPSAILVGGFDRNHGTLDVVEAKIARRVPDKIIGDVVELQREYNCLVWGVESVQFQEFLRTELIKRSAIAGVPVPARAVIPHTDKAMRIESLQPHVCNGLIKLHRNQSALIEQLRYWPEADHDDGPDALQILWMLAVSGNAGIPQIRSGVLKIRERLGYEY